MKPKVLIEIEIEVEVEVEIEIEIEVEIEIEMASVIDFGELLKEEGETILSEEII